MPTHDSRRGGVPAAPNRCVIDARIVSRKSDERWHDKVHLTLELLHTQDLDGPNFARPRLGSVVEAFAFDVDATFTPGTVIRADAQFQGDARGGAFRLGDLQLLEEG